jgi:hypothetical protein
MPPGDPKYSRNRNEKKCTKILRRVEMLRIQVIIFMVCAIID